VVIFLIGLTRTARWRWPAASAFVLRWNDPRFRFLLVLALLPLVLTAMAGLVFRLEVSTNMVIGIFSLAPLLVLELAGPGDDRRLHQLARRTALALMLGALVLSPVIAFAKFKFGKDINFLEPRKELAEAVTKIWRESTGLPLGYIGGSQRYQNAVAFYSADRP